MQQKEPDILVQKAGMITDLFSLQETQTGTCPFSFKPKILFKAERNSINSNNWLVFKKNSTNFHVITYFFHRHTGRLKVDAAL